MKEKFLIVTDLDGTLLTEDYSWKPAAEALAALKRGGHAVILNSSKTLAEMKELARELETGAPVIAENGGVFALPDGVGGYEIETPGRNRVEILELAHRLRKSEGWQFSGFADWSAEELRAKTGLPLEGAAMALDRHASEPILWEDSDENFAEFCARLAEEEIRVLRGGQFIHLMGSADKADGYRLVKKYYEERQPEFRWTGVALGDSANDLAMLEAAEVAVVIPRKEGIAIHPVSPRLIEAKRIGPAGWNEEILRILRIQSPESRIKTGE